MILLILILSLLFSLLTQWCFRLAGLWAGEKKLAVWARPVLTRAGWLFVWAVVLLIGTNYNFSAPFRFSWLNLLVAAAGMDLACALQLLWKSRRTRAKGPRRFALMLAMLLLVSLGLEFFLFNARSIQSFYYEPIELMSGVQSAAHNGSYDESTNIYSFFPEDPSVTVNPRLMLSVRDIEVDIQNLYIDVRAALGDEYAEAVTVSLAMDDDGTSQMFTTPSRNIFPTVERSKYIPIQSAGVSHKLTVTLTGDFDRLQVLSITANHPQPLQFSFGRVLLCLVSGLFVYCFRPGSALYATPLRRGDRGQTIIALVLAAVVALGFVSMSLRYQRAVGNDPANQPYQNSEYQRLAHQLAEGKVCLPEEVPAWLIEMENPYDQPLRDRLQTISGQSYLWDAAYYDGHYYVYFGVVPVVLMHLPYYLLTGQDLSNSVAVAIMDVLLVAALFILVRKLFFRYAAGGSFLASLLASLLLCCGSEMIVLAYNPGIYTTPIISGLALSVCGLSFWLGALEKEHLCPWRLLLGSLCMALVAGCRPQMLMFSFLALPLFWDEIFKKRNLLALKKRSILNTLCFALPYVAVAAALMYYNYIRFGSPFDFGANYNLTTNDMTVRGFNFERCGGALFSYLLQPPVYTSDYPFIQAAPIHTDYMGVSIINSTYGGLFLAHPFALLGLLIFRYRAELRQNHGFAAAAFLLASGFIVAIADAQMAGILDRYFADFSLMFLMAALLLFAVLHKHGDGRRKRLLQNVLFSGTLLSLMRTMFFAFRYLPERLLRSFEFWL